MQIIKKGDIKIMNSDTAKLLRICVLSCKYTNDVMEQIYPFVKPTSIKDIISIKYAKNMETWEKSAILLRGNRKPEMMKSSLPLIVSRIKRDVKLCLSSSSQTVASVVIDICHEDVKKLCKALGDFSRADRISVSMAKSIIRSRQELVEQMLEYF